MKLKRVQVGCPRDGAHPLLVGVDEDTDPGNEGRQGTDDVARDIGRDESRTGRMKYEPQRIGAGIHGGQGIPDRRDPADLDPDAGQVHARNGKGKGNSEAYRRPRTSCMS